MSEQHTYPIGIAGQPWSSEHRQQWQAQQTVQRSYADEVVTKVKALADNWDIIEYGQLPYEQSYPLFALKHKQWQKGRPIALVTGGVHGYESSGIHGALAFAKQVEHAQSANFNILVVPCISPWGYETINRWNPDANDPNRSFFEGSVVPEAQLLLDFIAPFSSDILLHIDLHETTDSDNSEFRPALAAREGVVNHNWNIPDGFYLVADSERPQASFQRAIIDAVAKVTHIAPADENNQLIGADLVQPGVIEYAGRKLGLCMGLTPAPYVTTTEVYPDSPQATEQNCIDAQVAAANSAIAFVAAL
ncbi:M14 family metallocarboxypeptidase [Pseudoalteromonas sp. MM17-2]|uniref:M14 family metallopeptidase n=1 Tax=Pseudoalteromonas sp. MM17-2 TaxID=2917753 RepID=UPI001EF44138|nr:M14 family metallocarboxypeptidase [Pseudoalteromonas sp. MM17-2]MCG7544461.1 M14 family metallocarboxypeptidase [Pseudoalteromonas sp. MM17-2]